MNSSQFMDKQIMDLTSSTQSLALGSSPKKINSSSSNDFTDLMNHHHHHHPPTPQEDSFSHNDNNDVDGIKREEIVASYDFQPIRPILDPTAADSKSNSSSASPLRNYGSLESMEPAKVVMNKDRNVFDAASIMSEIDRAMSKYSDNVLHVLEGVSARLTQLESRSRHLENSVDDLKLSVGNNHESTEGNMRLLHNILREVQTGVQVLKDKQEMLEAQLQLTKLQVSKADQQQLETQNTGQLDAVQQAASASQSHLLPPIAFPQSVPSVPSPIPQQNLSLPAPLPNQFPQNQTPPLPNKFPQNQTPPVPQLDLYYSPPGQSQEPTNPQNQVPPSHQLQPSSAAPPHQPYHAPQPQYSQPPQPHQLQPPLAHHPEETPFIPPQSYPPSLRPLSTQSPSGAPPQPYYGAPSNMYEPPTSRPNSGFSAGYRPPSGPTEPYPYGGSPTQYGSSPTMKQQQPVVSQRGGSGYPQLPTARILPQALPTASGIGTGSSSSGTGNRVPLDDVVEKVTNMGFPREHVQAAVRKLTENGQSVDLNVVLDKLMNDGDLQPQRGWFGR